MKRLVTEAEQTIDELFRFYQFSRFSKYFDEIKKTEGTTAQQHFQKPVKPFICQKKSSRKDCSKNVPWNRNKKNSELYKHKELEASLKELYERRELESSE